MTAADNKRVLRKWLKALQAGNAEALFALQTKDCAWLLPGSKKLAWAGHWKGQAQQKRYLKRIKETVDFDSQAVQEFIAEGSRVVVIGREIARSKPKAKRWTVTFAWAFTIRRGKVAAWEAFENTEIIAACY